MKHIRSDNGTLLVGAQSDFRDAISVLNQHRTQGSLTSNRYTVAPRNVPPWGSMGMSLKINKVGVVFRLEKQIESKVGNIFNSQSVKSVKCPQRPGGSYSKPDLALEH